MSANAWTAVEAIGVETDTLDHLPAERLDTMLAAGEEISECYRVLKKGGANIVGEVLKGQGKFVELDHYPKGDVYDKETHGQYFYHAHRGMPGENGHFHTFVRAKAIPDDIVPVPYDGNQPWPKGDNLVAHFVAISMDRYGFPIGLFGTNRWVTDEAWHCADDMIRLLPRFEIDHAVPSWPTNRWITAMFKLFRPQVEALLRQRDRVVDAWSAKHPDVDVFEDRKLEITGWLRVSVKRQLEAARGARAALETL